MKLLTLFLPLLTLILTPAAFAYDAQELDSVLNTSLESLKEATAAESQRGAAAKGPEGASPSQHASPANKAADVSSQSSASPQENSAEAPPALAAPNATAPLPPTGAISLHNLYKVIPNFKEVNTNILRGGQPTAAGIMELKGAGVHTIINLRNEEVLVRQEQQQAAAAGIKFINIPLDVLNAPSDSATKEFMRALDDSGSYPIYIHCLNGQDRTATMVALYRINRENWDTNRAYQEMVSTGFHPGFSRLSQAVFASGAKLGRPGTPPSGADIVEDIRKRVSRL